MEEVNYKILLDSHWDLEDLYKFPHTYSQIYYLQYALYPHDDIYLLVSISEAFAQYPWQGGYSAVNFYNKLKYLIPKKQRPSIVSIQYASPGWIELSLIPVIAYGIAKTLKHFCSSLKEINQTYTDIQKGMIDRKLLRIEIQGKEIDLEMKRIELEKKYQEFIDESATNLAGVLGFESLKSIDERTGSRLKTLKILSSYYRRLKIIADFQGKGKIKLLDNNKDE